MGISIKMRLRSWESPGLETRRLGPIVGCAVAGGWVTGIVFWRGLLAITLAGWLASPPSVAAEEKPDHERVVRAGRFELIDNSRRTRARLFTNDHGAGLVLLDEAGTMRATLYVGSDVPRLLLLDQEGKLRGTFAITADGSTMLQLNDKAGAETATLLATADGTSTLKVERLDTTSEAVPASLADGRQDGDSAPTEFLPHVTGGSVRWTNNSPNRRPLYDGAYSFSLHNGLGRAIRNVLCMVVFHDANGQAIETDTVQ